MQQSTEFMTNKKSIRLKEQFIIYFSVVGVISLLSFGAFSFFQGRTLYGSFELTAAFLALTNLLAFLKHKRVEVASAMAMIILAIVLSILLLTGGIASTGLLWMPTFPALAFFLFSKRIGFYINVSFVGLLLFYVFLATLGVFAIPFDYPTLRQFFASYIAISAIIFFYEMVSEGAWEKVQEKTKELTVLNKKLDKEAALREKNQAQTENSIIELEDTKKAMLNIMEDLQDQQQSLIESKAKDEAMLRSIGDGIIATDNQGVILFTNPSFERLLGWKQEEVVGKKLVEVIPLVSEDHKTITDDDRIISRTLEKQKTSKSTRGKVSYITKNGDYLPVSITVSPIIVEGKVIGAIEVFRDVTKENEVDRAKTEFVSLASHQLKTPLSAINWYSELLTSEESGQLNVQQKEYLEEIANGSKRMVDLVNALLNVSRLELGTFSIEPTELSILSVVRSVLDELKSKIDEKDLKVIENHEDIPIISADPNLTRIIIQNILTNAVKYTPSKGTITIDLKKVDEGATIAGQDFDTANIIYSVTDTGYGIPEGQKGKIFTKLFRADNVQEKDTDGTGLGLYIIKSILDSFGGKIWFVSEENKGTTFYVAIPVSGMAVKEGTRNLELTSTGNG